VNLFASAKVVNVLKHLLGAPFEPLILRLTGTARLFCSRRRSIREQTERAIHRLRVRKNIRELRLDQHQVGAGGCPSVVLSTDSTFQFGQVILRSETAIVLLRWFISHIVSAHLVL